MATIPAAEVPARAALPDLIESLRRARQAKALTDETVRAARAEYEAANADLFARQRDEAAALAAAEQAVRDAALAAYYATGAAAPAPGVQVKVFRTLRYDPAEALEWAKTSGLALQLDRAAFEKIAAATPLPFVQQDEDPRPQLAAKLPVPAPAGAPVEEDPFA